MKKAVEIGNEMLGANVRPLTENETKSLLSLIMFDQVKEPLPPEIKEMFMYQVCHQRLEAFGVPVHEIVPAYITILSDRPGIAVLYAAAIKAIYEQNKREVNLNDMINAFPWGVPTEEELHKIWDGQKCHDRQPDNWLDHGEAWR